MAAPDKPETRSHRRLIHPITMKECPAPAKGWRFTDDTMDQPLKKIKLNLAKPKILNLSKFTILMKIYTNPFLQSLDMVVKGKNI